MTKGFNRLKILIVLDALKKNSSEKSEDDEDRFLSAKDLISQIEKYAVERYGLPVMSEISDSGMKPYADRKSIYNYINSLEEFGFEIERNQHKGFYLLSSHGGFEAAELKLIVDALVSAKYISAKKTRQIISKLEVLANLREGSLQNRRLGMEKLIKSDNMSVIYNVDEIERAIETGKQISFRYQKLAVDFGAKGIKVLPCFVKDKNDPQKDRIYTQTPYVMVTHSENSYLICFDSSSQRQKTFRVDRMKDVRVLENKPAEGLSFFDNSNVADFTKSAFSMYDGDEVNVVLRVRKSMVDVITDRFGRNTSIYQDENLEFFRCSVNIKKSNLFFSWLSGFGRDVEMIFPDSLRREYKDYLEGLLMMYSESCGSAQ